MAKINVFFQDLRPEVREEIYWELRNQLREEIDETREDNPDIDPETIEAEVIDNYINTHNFANQFVL